MPIPIPGLNGLSDDTIFVFCSNVVFIPWFILAFAPKWKMRKPVVYGVVLMECLAYLLTYGSVLGNSEGSVLDMYASMGKLEGVVKLFSNDAVILPAWLHYLAFDLAVGNYLVEKNLENPEGLHQVLMVPVLVFLCMAGPIGVVLYAAMLVVAGLVRGKPSGKTS